MTTATERQLALIRELIAAAAGAGVPFWLRGGWAVDFAVGRVTREHDDVDAFAWAADADRLVAALAGRGFAEVGGPPPERQRNLVSDGVELHLTLLERLPSGAVRTAASPEWPPWPDGMLEGGEGRIGELACPVVSVASQLEVKRRYREARPDRPGRAKDRADAAVLEAFLARRG